MKELLKDITNLPVEAVGFCEDHPGLTVVLGFCYLWAGSAFANWLFPTP